MSEKDIPIYFIFKITKLGDDNREFLSHNDWVKFAYGSKDLSIKEKYCRYLCILPTKIPSYSDSVEDLAKNISRFMIEDTLNYRDARFNFSAPSSGTLHYENTEMGVLLYENMNNAEQRAFSEFLSKEAEKPTKEKHKIQSK